ncbi:hypothetical protein EON67_09695 [archaeon]|nr:MAG: hypothetical protein EON67_09695 [archaeon]
MSLSSYWWKFGGPDLVIYPASAVDDLFNVAHCHSRYPSKRKQGRKRVLGWREDSLPCVRTTVGGGTT